MSVHSLSLPGYATRDSRMLYTVKERTYFHLDANAVAN